MTELLKISILYLFFFLVSKQRNRRQEITSRLFDSLFTLRKQPSPPPPRISQAQFVIRGSIDVNKQSHPGCIIDQLFCVVPWVVVIPRLSVRLRQLLHTEPHRHESEGDSDNAAHKSDRERARRHAANRPMAPLAGRAGPPPPPDPL